MNEKPKETGKTPPPPNRDEVVSQELSRRFRDSQRFATQEEGGVRVAGAEKPSFMNRLFHGGIFQRIARADIIFFSRHLAMMLSIGIPVIRALQILSLRSPNHHLRKIIAIIGAKVEGGASIADALADFPKLFNDFFLNTVRAGEQSGTVDESLTLLADYLEKEHRMVNKFKSAMTYPIVAFVVAISVAILLLVKVIPVFEKIYREAKVELPGPTTFLLHLSRFVIGHYILIIIVVVALILLTRFMRWSTSIRYRLDWLKLRLPTVGDLLSKIVVYRFSKLMSIMVRSGVPIHSAMRISAAAVGNMVTAEALQEATILVSEGNTIEHSLRKTRAFRLLEIDIIGVGEETGSLDTILTQLAYAYEEELQTSMENLSVIIEPIMLLVIGSMVALIALSLFLPYFNLAPVLIPH